MRSLSRYIDEKGLFGRHGFPALDWHCSSVLKPALGQVLGSRALEIGAGSGLMSIWMLHAGARQVTSLEPEAAGATSGVARAAAEHRAALEIPPHRWDYRGETFQEFSDDGPFDIILSHSSINHLDEAACMQLGDSEPARERYLELFSKVRRLLAPGGHFIVSDCARINLWGRMGRPSPWAPEIEWEKHQEPETWSELLGAAGLETVDSRWLHPFYGARRFEPITRQKLVARCLASYFVIGARRASPEAMPA